MSSKLGSTLGFQRRFNGALRHTNREDFVYALMEGLPPGPPLVDQVTAKNRGLIMLKRPTPPRLQPADLRARLETGAVLVDLRDPRVFGAGHVAGSLSVAFDSPQLGERIGWFAEAGRPLVLLAETEADVARALAALARVGLDNVAGYVIGSAAVAASGLPTAELPNVTAPELAGRLGAERDLVVLDVREPVEWEEGHVAGALHIPMREVAGRLGELPRDRRIALMCRGGARSSLVGSLLLAHGFRNLFNTWGGMAGWIEAGLPVAQD